MNRQQFILLTTLTLISLLFCISVDSPTSDIAVPVVGQPVVPRAHLVDDAATGLYMSAKTSESPNWHLFRVAAEAGAVAEPLAIVDPPLEQFFPRISPDGRYILYDSGIFSGGSSTTHLLNLSTGNHRLMLDNAHPYGWHPSMQRFLYAKPGGCSESLYEAFLTPTLEVTSTRQIIDRGSGHSIAAVGASYSPDGNAVAFSACLSGCGYSCQEIYVAPLTGTLPLQDVDLLRLTNDSYQDNNPHWSPDGQKIMWIKEIQICQQAADGATPAECHDLPMVWAAGHQIATPPPGYTGSYIAAVCNDGTPIDCGLIRSDYTIDWFNLGLVHFFGGQGQGLDWGPMLYDFKYYYYLPFIKN